MYCDLSYGDDGTLPWLCGVFVVYDCRGIPRSACNAATAVRSFITSGSKEAWLTLLHPSVSHLSPCCILQICSSLARCLHLVLFGPFLLTFWFCASREFAFLSLILCHLCHCVLVLSSLSCCAVYFSLIFVELVVQENITAWLSLRAEVIDQLWIPDPRLFDFGIPLRSKARRSILTGLVLILECILVIFVAIRAVFFPQKNFEILHVVGLYDLALLGVLIFSILISIERCHHVRTYDYEKILEDQKHNFARQLVTDPCNQVIVSQYYVLDSASTFIRNVDEPVSILGIDVDENSIFYLMLITACGVVMALAPFVIEIPG